MKISSINYNFQNKKKQKSAYFKRKEKELIKHYHVHSKRRLLSLTDHQSTLNINQSENLVSSLTYEEMKMTNESDDKIVLKQIIYIFMSVYKIYFNYYS